MCVCIHSCIDATTVSLQCLTQGSFPKLDKAQNVTDMLLNNVTYTSQTHTALRSLVFSVAERRAVVDTADLCVCLGRRALFLS